MTCRIFIVFSCFFTYLFSGCNCHKSSKKVDVSDVEVMVEIRRFDIDLFKLEKDSLKQEIPGLVNDYPVFFPFYTKEIMGFGDWQKQPELTLSKLQEYLSDPYVQEVYDTCKKKFEDFQPYQNQLEQAFKHFRYYFPDKHIPRLVTFISNFGWSTITYDTLILGIGLDMYLGRDYVYYSSLFPQYLYEKFSAEYLAPNCIKILATMSFIIQPKDNTLLSQMITNGMILYFVDLMLPDDPDYVKIGYKPEDIEWCFANEPDIWKFFIDHELLYSTDVKQNSKYVSPGPYTAGMPQESPGDVGTWVGWQIVRAFMKKNPEVSFRELITGFKSQEILVKSGYKPDRSLL